MTLNKCTCTRCMGHRKVSGFTEEVCSQCNGRGYTLQPIFTATEAVEIAKYFGFGINGLEDENNDQF